MAQGEPTYKLAGRGSKPQDTGIEVKGHTVGGDELFMIAGPCAVESEAQLFEIAKAVKSTGVSFLRGGAFKPRTSPYSFQGLKEEGLNLLQQAAQKYDLGIVTEVMDLSLLDTVYPYTDILQIGSRNMKNYHFLKALGKTDKPILISTGLADREDISKAKELIEKTWRENRSSSTDTLGAKKTFKTFPCNADSPS